MRVSFPRKETGYLLLVVLAAAMLRLIMIDQPFIDATSWRQTDTAGFAQNFYRFDSDILTPDIIWNGPGANPVGYEFQTATYLASLLYRVFGQHDWIGRMIAVVFGVWKIAAFFLLARRVWDGRVALVSAAILSALPGSIYVDRSFLPDPVMLSLVVTSAWALVAWLQTERPLFLVVATIAGLVGVLTKISGAIVALPLLYAIVVYAMRRRDRGLHSGGAAAAVRSAPAPALAPLLGPIVLAGLVVLIPVLAYYAWALHLASEPPYYGASGGYWVWKFGLGHFAGQAYFVPQLVRQLDWFWTLPFAAVAAAGFLWRPPANAKLPYFFHAWLIAFGLYYLVAAKGLVENPTNLNLLNPAAAALAANLLVQLWQKARQSGSRALSLSAAAAIAALLGLIGTQGYRGLRDFAYYPWSRSDYRLGLELRRLAGPGDLVVTSGFHEADPTAIYYSGHRGWIFPPLESWPDASSGALSGAKAIAAMERLRERGADWYGVVNAQAETFAETRAGFLEYLDRFPSYRSDAFTVYHLSGARGDDTRSPQLSNPVESAAKF